MELRIKVDGKYRNVSCADAKCPNRDCFHAGQFLHRTVSIDGAAHYERSKSWSCLNRDYRGCPDSAFEKECAKDEGK